MSTSSIEHVVIGRRYKHAPHDSIMYDAIVDDRGRWLVLRPGEVIPEVAEAHRPNLVILRPWLDPTLSAVEIRIENFGRGAGSALTVLGYGTQDELPPEDRKRIRHRLGVVFGAELRGWVDPYWAALRPADQSIPDSRDIYERWRALRQYSLKGSQTHADRHLDRVTEGLQLPVGSRHFR